MIKNSAIILCFLCLSFISCSKSNSTSQKPDNHQDMYMLVGTYTSGSSTGIYVYKLDIETGNLKYVSKSPDISNPSYLTVSADEQFVYAVCENDMEEAAAVALKFDKKDGSLKLLNKQPVLGTNPCYVAINSGRNFICTPNYGSDKTGGSLSVLPVDSSGALLPASQVLGYKEQENNDTGSHIHTAAFTPDEKYLFVTDLGKDKIYRHTVKIDSESGLFLQEEQVAAELESGSGPRHLAFHPNGKYMYCISEVSGKVTAFQYNAGVLTAIQSIASDTTSGIGGKGSADIHLTPDGKFLYSSNRLKADGIAIFSVNNDGTLTKVGYQSTGIHPRNFIITPNGRFLLAASRESNNVCVFSIDKKTGLLHDTGKLIEVNQPVCLKFMSFNQVSN